MKAQLYRDSPVLKSLLGDFEGFGDVEKLPVYAPDPRFVVVPAGTINCRQDSWLLVKQGTAKPVDDECRKKANVGQEDMIRKHDRQILLEAGKLTGDPKLDAPDKEA